MTYFEYSIEIDKSNLQFNVSLSKLMDPDIYNESFSSFFNKLINAIVKYIDDIRDLHIAYRERNKFNKELQYIENLCKHKAIANQTIYVRGYNGKLIKPNSMNEYIQLIKNIITYAKMKNKSPKISEYLEQYELQRASWDTFYSMKIKDVPKACKDAIKELDELINELKTSLINLSSYFDSADDTVHEFHFKDKFKKFILKIKDAISRDVNIITMNFEAIRYEIGKKFSKIVKTTSDKVIKKDISSKNIMNNSKFIKEITYGTDIYKVYETEYNNVSAFIYGGSLIYVENDFFELPKGYQLATLYHEIGHDQCRHFKPHGFKSGKINEKYNIDVEDTEVLVHRIKKDLNKFLHNVYKSDFSSAERYNNGEEFLYLLIELDADRFAADIVGKRLIRKSLKHDMDLILDVPAYKDVKKQTEFKKFNNDRTKIRNILL